jgi:hypothetical protein
MSKFIQEYQLRGGLTAVVVDIVGLVREELKAGIPDNQVAKYLPFNTSIVEGDSHFHIRNESVYPVDTKHHTIENGDTLCAHWNGARLPELRYTFPTCPGCIAKAKNIVASHLLNESTNPKEF